MATKTEALIQELTTRLNAAEMRLDALQVDVPQVKATFVQVAVMEHRLADLTKSQDVWGNRGWVIFMVGVSGVVTLLSAAAGGLLTFYLNAKR